MSFWAETAKMEIGERDDLGGLVAWEMHGMLLRKTKLGISKHEC